MSSESTLPVEKLVEEDLKAKREQLNAKIQKLFRDGVLVQLNITSWTMQATLEKGDLAIDSSVDASVPVKTFGTKWLLPAAEAKKFDSIEQAARNCLRNQSMVFPISGAFFVPKRRVAEVVAKLQTFQQKHAAAVEAFIAAYPALKEEMLGTYPGLAEHQDQLYPSVERIKGKFNFVIRRFEICMPKGLREDTQNLTVQEEAAKQLLRQQQESLAAEYADSVKELTEFVRNTVASMRQPIVDCMSSLLEKIEDGEVVTNSSKAQIQKIVSKFRELDFVQDTEILRKVNEIQQVLESATTGPHADKSSTAQLATTVKEIISQAMDISDIDRVTGEYFRAIG